MDQQLRNASVNAREVRKIRALEKIAAHLEGINTTLGMWHAEQRGDCDPFESPAFLSMNRTGEVTVERVEKEE